MQELKLRAAVPAKILSAFLLCSLLAMVIEPAYFHYRSKPSESSTTTAYERFFLAEDPTFDAVHYASISVAGYEDPSLAAFYPLWPIVMAPLAHVLYEHRILLSQLLAFMLFASALFLLTPLLSSIYGVSIAGAAMLLFALNPNSIFHVLGYPESLVTFVSAAMLWSWWSTRHRYLALLALLCGYVIGLSRPFLPQQVFACVGALLIAKVMLRFSWQEMLPVALKMLATMVGGLLGLMTFCVYTWFRFGDFLATFHAQESWGRKVGLYWQLIYKPVSVGYSDNVRVWDLQALYGPALVLGVIIWALKSRPQRQPLAVVIGLYGALFALAHSLINFVTLPLLTSIGRHVFATPMFYVGAACALFLIQPQDGKWTRGWRIAFVSYAIISAVYLIHWWTRYSRNGWIG